MEIESEELHEIIRYNIFKNSFMARQEGPYYVIRAMTYIFAYLNNKLVITANKFFKPTDLGISVITYDKYDVDAADEFRNETALFFYNNNGEQINNFYDKFGRRILTAPIIKDLGGSYWQPSTRELHAKSFDENKNAVWWKVELDGLHLEQ
jgi:hypothetical protein